jgi:hypothetical protein
MASCGSQLNCQGNTGLGLYQNHPCILYRRECANQAAQRGIPWSITGRRTFIK